MAPVSPTEAGSVGPGAPSSKEELSRWRAQILNATLVVTAVLAGIAYIPGVAAAIRAELWLLVVADTLVWAVVIVLAIWRTLPYAFRAWGFVTLAYLLAILLLPLTGPGGGGAIWLLSVPVITSIFLGLRGATISLSLILATVLGFGFLIHLDRADLPAGIPGGGYDLGAWIGMSGSLVFLAAILSLSISYLVRSLERSLEEAENSRRGIIDAKVKLEGEIRERKRLEVQLLQSQKMEALGTLAGGIAHDFNNLLVPILLDSREVRDRLPVESPERADLEEVVRSAQRARELVQRILTFSRGASSDRLPLDLEAVMREVGTLLRSTLPADIRIEYALNAGGPRVRADSSEIHQILMNLATNAYLAMKSTGGVITLASARDPEDGMVTLQVRDNGPGIDPEIQARVFDPFFTTRAPGEGTGLGLAIVHRLATGLGGEVTLRSASGGGTVAEVRLPEMSAPWAAHEGSDAATSGNRIEPGGSPPGNEVPETEPPTRISDLSILVVDDEPAVRRTMGMVLGRLGYQVEEAESPESALRRIEESPEAFDLLITDQAMPGMTGLELARRARKIRSDLPILLASGYLDAEAQARAKALELTGVIQKPYDRAGLAALVRSALGHDPGTAD